MAQLIIEVDDEILKKIGVEEIKNMFQRFLKSKEKEREKNDLKIKERQDSVNDLKQALHEVELHQQGKITLQSARDFLKELREENQ